MTDRLETNVQMLPRLLTAAFLLMLAPLILTGCAGAAPRLAQGENGSVLQTAPRLSQFQFDNQPFTAAVDFAPWSALAAQSVPDQTALEACIADKAACATPNLVRFRRMMELAQGLEKREQLSLVHHYFNSITWTNDARDTWSTLYHTALNGSGDCEDIALAKYQTLRRLGWSADQMRVLIGWDGEENDWHAWLAVTEGEDVLVLDSIEGLQRPSAYRHARVVYSISDQGVWDHAPDYVPATTLDDRRMASERAARHAAIERQQHKGVLR